MTNHGYLHSAVWKTLHNFKIKRAQEARHNQFLFQYVQKMRSLRSSKCLKTTVELTFTIQKTSACSPWTACSVFNWKYQFSWVNLVQKLKFFSLNWNFVPRLIKICRISWWCSLFLFSTANTFLGKFGPKNQICQFELKFRTRLLWIYAELCRKYVVFTFSVLGQKNTFWVNLVKKNKNYHFKLKFGTKTNLNKQNSMMMFTFSVFDQPYLSWANSVQKFKIVCSKWDLIKRLIQICRIQWWCLFYLF